MHEGPLPGRKETILVLGGTGYLGQFLVQKLSEQYKVGIVYHSTAEPAFRGDVHHFWVDLASGEGLAEAFEALRPVAVVINCAAISSPAACEKQPARARSINVPTRLLDILELQKGGSGPLLIHISTDQVYDGSRSNWREDDECSPVNVYGKTKREAEIVIQERWDNHIILRSSLIFGAQTPFPVTRLLFLQFVERTLQAGKPTKFFADEFRSPVYVMDIVRVVLEILQLPEPPKYRLFNLGGPERLSRVDIAETVANVWGYPKCAIEAASASSVTREVASPLDISMDVSRITSEFPAVTFRTLAEALAEMQQQPKPRKFNSACSTPR